MRTFHVTALGAKEADHYTPNTPFTAWNNVPPITPVTVPTPQLTTATNNKSLAVIIHPLPTHRNHNRHLHHQLVQQVVLQMDLRRCRSCCNLYCRCKCYWSTCSFIIFFSFKLVSDSMSTNNSIRTSKLMVFALACTILVIHKIHSITIY